jgi:hypothetical protein
MKRTFFIILSIISKVIIAFTFFVIFSLEWSLHYLIVMTMLFILLYAISYNYSIIIPPFGFISLKLKKIFFDDIDDEILVFIKNYDVSSDRLRISIWKQNLFYVKKLGQCYSDRDINEIKNKIKGKLEILYKEEINKNRIDNLIKNWNGCLDQRSERNRKLSKILK